MPRVFVEVTRSIVPQRRTRSSHEIIDVDLLDDGVIHRPTQRRRMASSVSSSTSSDVIVLDSDDEQSVSSQNLTTRPRRSGAHIHLHRRGNLLIDIRRTTRLSTTTLTEPIYATRASHSRAPSSPHDP